MSLAPRNILVRGVNWLGDAVMSTPALLRLREQFPDARIILQTPEKLDQLWTGHPAVDATLPFGPHDTFASMTKRLRAEHFDTALILPNSFRSAAEAFVAGIPNRVGYAGQLRSLFLNRAVRQRAEGVSMHKRNPAEIARLVASSAPPQRTTPPPQAHHVYQYLHLVAAMGGSPAALPPMVQVHEREVADACVKFRLPRGHDLMIGINPGAEYGAAKRWPAEYFVKTIRELRKNAGARFLIFGGKNDRELANRIVADLSGVEEAPNSWIVSLAGQTTLRELCALAKACTVFITNDTGPMHVAAAVGTPVIVPFGSTSPALTGPWPAERHKLLDANVACAPCFLRECPIDFRCMRQVEPAQVIAATLGALALGSASAS